MTCFEVWRSLKAMGPIAEFRSGSDLPGHALRTWLDSKRDDESLVKAMGAGPIYLVRQGDNTAYRVSLTTGRCPDGRLLCSTTSIQPIKPDYMSRVSITEIYTNPYPGRAGTMRTITPNGPLDEYMLEDISFYCPRMRRFTTTTFSSCGIARQGEFLPSIRFVTLRSVRKLLLSVNPIDGRNSPCPAIPHEENVVVVNPRIRGQ